MKTTTKLSWRILLILVAASSANATITINETWVTDPGVNAKNAWAAVETYYQTAFSSSYATETWNITLDWKTLGGGIAQGGPRGAFTLGSDLKLQPGATTARIHDKVYYESALANHLANSAFVSGENMSVSFNNTTNWDYSTSSTANGTESFYATAIHEIAHGLGFISNDAGAAGGWVDDKPYVFDYYLGLGTTGTDLLIEKTTEQLAAAFVSNNVYWTGTNGNTALGSPAKIYAPSPTYQSGSSMSHLDFSINPSLSLLMYPSDAPGLPLAYSYSALELGMWKDMGYDVVPEPATIVFLALSGGCLLAFGAFRRRLSAFAALRRNPSRFIPECA